LGSSLRSDTELQIVNTSPSQSDGVYGSSRLRWSRVQDALRILGSLLWQLLRFRPQVVHINTPYQWAMLRDGLAVWIASLFRAHTVLHFRGGDFPESVERAPRLVRWATRATLRRTDRLLALTRHTELFLRGVVGPDSVRYVPNFVKVADFGAPPERASRGNRAVEVLFVGWIIPAKGVQELVDVASRIPQAHFTLVGPAEHSFSESLRPSLAALGERVTLLDPRPREDILELYQRADIFVLPTWREGFPNVVLEAMASGLPVVATPVGAIPDAIRAGQEGLLIPPRDAQALEAALRQLVENATLRLALGKRARTRAEEVFDLEAVIAQLRAVYDELFESTSRSAAKAVSDHAGRSQ